MAKYMYQGKRESGESVSGQVEARNKDEAVEIISQQGILPFSVKEMVSSSGMRNISKIKFKDIFIFSRQLSSLIKAGIPILRSIEIIKEQTSNIQIIEILNNIYAGIKDGRNFSDCLLDYPSIFSPLYVAMVRVGEEGGNLRDVLLSISDHQKSQKEIMSKVKTAFAYPVFMGFVGFLTIVFILTFVMPKILLAASNSLRFGWFIILPTGILIFYFLIKWARSENGFKLINRLQLRLPIVGELITKIELGRFCRTLELLLRSGVGLVRAIDVAIPTLNNTVIIQELSQCKDSLALGDSLSKSFEQCSHISSMMLNLIKVGEESGLLEETLHDIADTYEQESDEAIKTFTSILEPAMILFVGVTVGFVVIAMLLPIFQMDVFAS